MKRRKTLIETLNNIDYHLQYIHSHYMAGSGTMKTKVFVPTLSQSQKTKSKKDYWNLVFVSLVFITSISCFLFDSYQEQTLKVSSNEISLDSGHHQKI